MMKRRHVLWILIGLVLMMSACMSAPNQDMAPTPAEDSLTSDVAEADTENADDTPEPSTIWRSVELTDATTGEGFTINDFRGKVVVVSLIATWCPTCLREQAQLKTLRETVNSDDLVVVTLGVDRKEDVAVLKQYAEEFGFDWRFAIATLEVNRDIGNTYGALFLDPSHAPMLVVDRGGGVYSMTFGLKEAEDIREVIEPLLENSSQK